MGLLDRGRKLSIVEDAIAALDHQQGRRTLPRRLTSVHSLLSALSVRVLVRAENGEPRQACILRRSSNRPPMTKYPQHAHPCAHDLYVSKISSELFEQNRLLFGVAFFDSPKPHSRACFKPCFIFRSSAARLRKSDRYTEGNRIRPKSLKTKGDENSNRYGIALFARTRRGTAVHPSTAEERPE